MPSSHTCADRNVRTRNGFLLSLSEIFPQGHAPKRVLYFGHVLTSLMLTLVSCNAESVVEGSSTINKVTEEWDDIDLGKGCCG